jgi:hypothetical protein
VRWYGNVVGNPGNLNMTIFADKNGGLDSSRKLASSVASASSFTNSTGWQNGVQAKGTFSAGWYWVKFSSPSSDKNNLYTFYLKDYLINNATAYAAQSEIGPGLQQGSTILWLENQAGKSLEIYPYQEAGVGAPEQTITATHAFTFNTVFLFLSDRAYNQANATLTVTDTSDGGIVVATGLLSQALVGGLENWVPIALNTSVTTVPGHEYLLTMSDPSVTWTTVMRYVTTSPAQAGFQNQSQTLLFQLADVDWIQGLRDWGGMTSTGNDAVTNGYMDAVRFSPSANETLKSVQILMTSSQGTNQNYSSGAISVSIWGSKPDGSAPEGSLQQLTVPGTRVPQNGLLKVTGFNTTVTAGDDYWIVFSANSTQHFTFGRLTSPFEFLVLSSANGGASWYNPSEGPTEYAFTVTLSKETLGTFVAGSVGTSLTSNGIFAQPFIATSDTSIEGVYIGPLIPGPHLLISISPTGADGKPTVSPIGSGVYDAGNITLDYGPQFVQFSSVANLQKGQEYWIEIHPIGGGYQISSLNYLNGAPAVPANSSAVVSNNNGLTWKDISNTTALISEYLLEAPIALPPQYGIQAQANDLLTNHDFAVSSGPLKGWNAYVQASELSTFSGVAQWFSNFTGRSFEFYGNAQENVLSRLNLKDMVVLPTTNSTLTCAEFLGDERSALASGVGQFSYAPLSLLQTCASSGAQDLASQLNYLPYLGSSYGSSTSTRVLVVGDQTAANLTSYLSNAFNATYVNLGTNPDLRIQNNLSSFVAVLWMSPSSEAIPPSVAAMLSLYVRYGGELVTTDPSLDNLSALAPVAGTNTSAVPALDGPSFLEAALAHTQYTNSSFQEAVTNTTLTARSTALLISARVVGLGKVVFVGFGGSSVPQTNDQSVVVSNIIANAAGAKPPLWYESTDAQASSMGTYSVEGTYANRLLLWIFNSATSAATFTLDLNGSYYGVPSSWETVQIPGPTVSLGSGPDVRIQTTVPAGALIGVLIVPRSEPLISYSSGLVQTQFAYPDQALYSILGKYNQSVLVVISTNELVGQILLNDRTSLPQASSVGQLYNGTSGWYFDGKTDSLFVKYQSTGVDTLRFAFYSPPVPPPTVFPQQLVVTVFEAAIAVEVLTLAFLLVRRRRRPGMQEGANPRPA